MFFSPLQIYLVDFTFWKQHLWEKQKQKSVIQFLKEGSSDCLGGCCWGGADRNSPQRQVLHVHTEVMLLVVVLLLLLLPSASGFLFTLQLQETTTGTHGCSFLYISAPGYCVLQMMTELVIWKVPVVCDIYSRLSLWPIPHHGHKSTAHSMQFVLAYVSKRLPFAPKHPEIDLLCREE